MTSFTGQLRRVAGAEWGLLLRYPKLRLSAAGILLLPALYALIYLSSVWDPNAHTRALPVALVSEDAFFVSAEVARGAEKLETGAGQLAEGLRQAVTQQERLQAGTKQLETGVYRAMAGPVFCSTRKNGRQGWPMFRARPSGLANWRCRQHWYWGRRCSCW